jgi:hypothetical protein
MAFDPATTSGLAAQLFRPGTPQAFALVRAAWTAAVGAELARRTVVQAMVGRTLHVRVPDAAWRKTLHRMRREVLARLREIAGELAPTTLGFVEGPVPAGEPAWSTGPRPLPVPAPAALRAAAERIADPEVRARFLETAARYLSRAVPDRDGGPEHA